MFKKETPGCVKNFPKALKCGKNHDKFKGGNLTMATTEENKTEKVAKKATTTIDAIIFFFMLFSMTTSPLYISFLFRGNLLHKRLLLYKHL